MKRLTIGQLGYDWRDGTLNLQTAMNSLDNLEPVVTVLLTRGYCEGTMGEEISLDERYHIRMCSKYCIVMK